MRSGSSTPPVSKVDPLPPAAAPDNPAPWITGTSNLKNKSAQGGAAMNRRAINDAANFACAASAK
jgi:hypothetical protein